MSKEMKNEDTKTTERLTPGQAKRKLCIQCIGTSQFNSGLVKDCGGDKAGTGACPIYPYRTGNRVSVKTIRKFCLNCMGGTREFVFECETNDCPAHEFRMGKNPVCAGKISMAGIEALQRYRENAPNLLLDTQIIDD